MTMIDRGPATPKKLISPRDFRTFRDNLPYVTPRGWGNDRDQRCLISSIYPRARSLQDCIARGWPPWLADICLMLFDTHAAHEDAQTWTERVVSGLAERLDLAELWTEHLARLADINRDFADHRAGYWTRLGREFQFGHLQISRSPINANPLIAKAKAARRRWGYPSAHVDYIVAYYADDPEAIKALTYFVVNEMPGRATLAAETARQSLADSIEKCAAKARPEKQSHIPVIPPITIRSDEPARRMGMPVP